MDIISIGAYIINGLLGIVGFLFWNKVKGYEANHKDLSSKLELAQRDINMAHNKIILAATKDELGKNMQEFRAEMAGILDKQEQRQNATVTRIEESIRSLQTMFKDDLREIFSLLKSRE